MQTGGCDVSGEFMALRNEKQKGGAEIDIHSRQSRSRNCVVSARDP